MHGAAPEICEVCSVPATVRLVDVREITPVADESGRLWCRWAADGSPHHFCAEHARRSRTTFLPRPHDEQYRLEERVAWNQVNAEAFGRMIHARRAADPGTDRADG